jgi:hypothetical protein
MTFKKSVMFEGVEFVYLGGLLSTVIYGAWPFPVEEGSLGYPGGYPMPKVLLDQVVGQGRTGRQLNEEMNLAREICLDAYPRFLASPHALKPATE